MKMLFHKWFGKCVPKERLEIQEVRVCPPNAPEETRKLRIVYTECEICGRTLNITPRGFAD